MRVRAARNRVTIWLAALALALQLAAPALYAPMRLGALPGFLGDLLGFCHAHEPLRPGHHHHDDGAPQPTKQTTFCPVLKGLQAAGSAVPAVAVLLPPRPPADRPDPVLPQADAPVRLLVRPQNPRAPPLHA